MLKAGALCLLLFFACCINSGLGLKCYECWGCTEKNPPKAIQCPKDSACFKIGLKLEVENIVSLNLIQKSCTPKNNINHDCKQILKDAMAQEKGASTQTNVDFDAASPDIDCHFCESDYCNSSSFVYPSIWVLGTLLTSYVFY